MKKYIYIVLFIFLASMLTAGCTGSSSEKTASTSSEKTASTSSEKTASTSIDQDVTWKENVQKNSAILQTDFENIGVAVGDTNNPDYATLETTGQNIINDSQKALTENNQSTVSSKYQDAQKEWVLALEDCNSAGEYLIIVANDGKTGNLNVENVNNVTSYSKSVTAHLKRSKTLIQIADQKLK